jgi:hypothetical protein
MPTHYPVVIEHSEGKLWHKLLIIQLPFTKYRLACDMYKAPGICGISICIVSAPLTVFDKQEPICYNIDMERKDTVNVS